MSSKIEHPVPSVATLGPRGEIAPDERETDVAAGRVNAAVSVAILCAAGCRGSADLLRELSDRLKAPLVHTVRGKDIIAYDDPRWMGGLGMIGTKPAYNAVQGCDLLLMVGTDYPYSNFLPSHGSVIQIDERAAAIGRRAPTALGVRGSVRPTLAALLPRVRPRTESAFFDEIAHSRRA